jgi:hypothetical protein
MVMNKHVLAYDGDNDHKFQHIVHSKSHNYLYKYYDGSIDQARNLILYRVLGYIMNEQHQNY